MMYCIVLHCFLFNYNYFSFVSNCKALIKKATYTHRQTFHWGKNSFKTKSFLKNLEAGEDLADGAELCGTWNDNKMT